ncbi:MAG: protein kinase, partial [Elusimicrobiota bacterium]
AANPVAERDRQEVARLVTTENPAAAREYALAALDRNPADLALLSFVKLSAPVKSNVDQRTVKSRIAELAAGMRQDEGAGNDAILASPISFGAMAGGASRGPAALPAGAVVPDLHANAVYREAGTKITIKDYAGAETVLTRRIEENPSDAAAFHLRALTRRLLTRYQDSADDARKAVALNPRDSRSLHLLSRDLTDLGRPQEGLVEAERALAINNNDAQAYVARSEALRVLGRAEERLSDLARAAAIDPKFAPAYEDALALNGGKAVPSRSGRSGPIWLGAIGTALLFFSFALYRKRGDTSARVALSDSNHFSPAAVPRADAVPKGFSLVKVLGQGGMGVVFEALDLALQRTVALKKLRPEIAENPRERIRFLKEARTVAALKHPNIVEIHAIHEDEQGLFLVFERVPGESLHERLGRGPINPAEAAAFLGQIASALDYAHGQGVVHQDLKPGNVMIHAGLAKVMDFGIARRVQESLSTMSKIEVAGTPAYMSPEQEQGVVTPSADVFALGVCAYESLTGVLPFPTGGLMLKAQKMYRKPSEAAPSLRAGVDSAIARALEPRPEDRWPSASSFVEALSRSLQS